MTLRKASQAILDYRLQGSAALAAALDSIYGAMWARAASDPEAWEQEKDSEPVGKLEKVAGRLEQIVARYPNLAAMGVKLLSMGPKMITDGS